MVEYTKVDDGIPKKRATKTPVASDVGNGEESSQALNNEREFLLDNPKYYLTFRHLIDAVLAGMLVFAGAFATGNIDKASAVTAISAAVIVAVTKFRDYWNLPRKAFLFF